MSVLRLVGERGEDGAHWLAIRADSGATANGGDEQAQPWSGRLHSLLHSEFDGLIFSLAIPALGTILLDPIMSMVDTGMMSTGTWFIPCIPDHTLFMREPAPCTRQRHWLGTCTLQSCLAHA